MSEHVGAMRSFDDGGCGEGDNRPLSAKYDEQHEERVESLVQYLMKDSVMLKARVHTLEMEVRFLQEGHAETNRVIAQMKKTIDKLILGTHT